MRALAAAASPLVVDVDEAARRLGVSSQTVHNLRVRDRFPLPAIQPAGPRGRVLVPVAALEEWVLAESADPTRGWSSAASNVVALRAEP